MLIKSWELQRLVFFNFSNYREKNQARDVLNLTYNGFPEGFNNFSRLHIPFRAEQGTSLETPSRARASSCKRWEQRGLSRVAAGFSTYDGDLSLPLGLALGSPIFPSRCEGKLGVALESLQGRRDLT